MKLTSNAVRKENTTIVPFAAIKGGKKEQKIKLTKDGEVKKTKSNKEAGKSSEVFALKSEEEINAILEVLNRKIADAIAKVEETNGEKPMPIKQKRNAYRNKLVWLIGMNVGIRASDLLVLKWSFFFNINEDNSLEWHPYYSLQPQKQRKQHKFVKLYFNQTVKKAIEDYLEIYPITKTELDSYIFTNDKGNHITTQQLWNVICDTAKEAGLVQNVGTHTLRKTWGFHCWHNAKDKDKALIILQKCFEHSSPQTTLRYIGILDSEIEDMYNSIELGLQDM